MILAHQMLPQQHGLDKASSALRTQMLLWWIGREFASYCSFRMMFVAVFFQLNERPAPVMALVALERLNGNVRQTVPPYL